MARPQRIEPGPGQESVWDYPRPPAVRPCERRVRVEWAGEVLADSIHALRVLETEKDFDAARQAAYVAGHSLGEYSALCAAESISLEDAARLLRLRGEAMQKAVPVGEGAMAAILGLEFASLIGNAFIVEMVFAWPGIASYGLRAILSKDFNAVMAVVLVSGLFFVVANLLVDLAVALIDPRLRVRTGLGR